MSTGTSLSLKKSKKGARGHLSPAQESHFSTALFNTSACIPKGQNFQAKDLDKSGLEVVLMPA